MLDELDDGARIGIWTALGVVSLLLFGLLGGLVLRQGDKAAPAAVVVVDEVVLLDVEVSGDSVVTLVFETASVVIGAEGLSALDAAGAAAAAAPTRRLLISGYHDTSGDAAANHELAKQRALAVRAALRARGIADDRLLLRKPASAAGGTPDDPASRRVEIHLVD